MRAQFDTEPTLGMNSIEDLFVDPNSRDDTSQIILALQSIWMATDLRDRIVMYLKLTLFSISRRSSISREFENF